MVIAMINMTGIILAGGQSKRLGVDKAELIVGGRSILERTVLILKQIFAEVIVVSNVYRDIAAEDAIQVKDIAGPKGALGGIYTGLYHASYDRSFITACDMPYIKPQLVRLLAKRRQKDVVVPRVNGNFEPLFAVYSNPCIPIIEQMISCDILKISDLYEKCSVEYVEEESLRKVDKNLKSFININSLRDLKHI